MNFGIGQPVTRKEDPRFLTGRGRYVDDIDLAAPDLCGVRLFAARACRDQVDRHQGGRGGAGRASPC